MSGAVLHIAQPDSLELRGHLVMFQSATLQGQPGLVPGACGCLVNSADNTITMCHPIALHVSWLQKDVTTIITGVNSTPSATTPIG